MAKSKIQRRSVRLQKDLIVTTALGKEIRFPMGTVFFNYRPNSKSEWDGWFYEYEISGGLGLGLTPDEYSMETF